MKFQEILDAIFPSEINNNIFAYMPSDGSNSPQMYTDFWKDIADKYGAEFRFIDNTKENAVDEAKKLLESNILLITGGNTFGLLNYLRKSGLDNVIKKFVEKDEFVLSGFSAGAIVLSPTIKSAEIPTGNDPTDMIDENKVGLKDLTGLNIIDFEVFPHFDEILDRKTLEEYREQTPNEVREINNDEYIVLGS